MSAVLTGPSIKRGQSSGDIWTPRVFIDAVEKTFGPLVWDLAATAENARCENYYTPKENSLSIRWAYYHAGCSPLWLNPPYSNIAPWAEKCAVESGKGACVLLLVPGSIGANWYWDFVEPYSNVYSVGRMVFDNCFDKDGKLVTTVYSKDLILCHYDRSQPRKQMERWKWRRQ